MTCNPALALATPVTVSCGGQRVQIQCMNNLRLKLLAVVVTEKK